MTVTGKHLRTGLLVAALAMWALAAACSSAASEPDGAASSQHAIPASATMIGRVNVVAILADDAVDDLFGALPPEDDVPSSLADALTMIQDETGIDPAKVTEIVLFATGSDDDSLGLILTGTLAIDELVAAVEAAKDVTAESSELFGHTVYVFDTDDGNGFSLAALNDGRIVAGGTEAVRASVTVDAGKGQAVSGNLIDRLDALGTPWLSLVADVSATDVSKLMGPDGMLGEEGMLGGELPIDLSAFADVQSISLALDRAGAEFTANVDIGFGSEDAATRAVDMVNDFTSLFKAFVPDPGLLSFLDGLEIEAVGTDLSIDFAIATDEATKLVGDLLTSVSEEGQIQIDVLDIQ